MRIGKKKISVKNLPFVIAEIGMNHNGNLDKAFKLIDHAVTAKCDAVKFQTIKINKLIVKNTPLIKYQKTNFSNMNDLIKKYNLSYFDFIRLKIIVKKKNNFSIYPITH